jgi:hypothetical protein
MTSQTFVRTCSIWLMAVASLIGVDPVRAQSAKTQPQPSASEPNLTGGDRELIRREQAPLPLNRVYQTPIEQFEPPFTDVPKDHWAYEAVTRLFYSGVVKGDTPTKVPTQFK